MSLKLIKKKFGRRRFLSLKKVQSFVDWKIELAELIDWIEKNTRYQRVGTDVYFYISENFKIEALMIEVMGMPEIPDTNAFTVVDFESEYCLQLDSIKDQFEFTPQSLLDWAQSCKTRLDSALLSGQKSSLCDFFLIVFNHEKLALQFFSKNDYIQKRP